MDEKCQPLGLRKKNGDRSHVLKPCLEAMHRTRNTDPLLLNYSAVPKLRFVLDGFDINGFALQCSNWFGRHVRLLISLYD